MDRYVWGNYYIDNTGYLEEFGGVGDPLADPPQQGQVPVFVATEILLMAARLKEAKKWQSRARAFLRKIDHCADDACCPGCYASLLEEHGRDCEWVALLTEQNATPPAEDR